MKDNSAHSLLATLEGRLLAIDTIREAIIDEIPVRLNKALFQISLGMNHKMGIMIFWGEKLMCSEFAIWSEISVCCRLRNRRRALFLLYFLPGTTRFEESMQHAFSCPSEAEPNC